MAKKKEVEDANFEILQDLVLHELDDNAPWHQLIDSEETALAIAASMLDVYGEMIIDIENDELMSRVKSDHSSAVRVRTSLGKRATAARKVIKVQHDKIVDAFAPIESKLKTALDAKKAAEEAKAEALRKEREMVIQGRKQDLHDLGAVWGGSAYQLGDVIRTPQDIEDNEKWPQVLADFQEAAEEVAKEKARVELINKRREELEAAGMVWEHSSHQFVLGDLVCKFDDIPKATDDKFEKFVEHVKIEKARIDAKAAAERAELEELRALKAKMEAENAKPEAAPEPPKVEIEAPKIEVEQPKPVVKEEPKPEPAPQYQWRYPELGRADFLDGMKYMAKFLSERFPECTQTARAEALQLIKFLKQ